MNKDKLEEYDFSHIILFFLKLEDHPYIYIYVSGAGGGSSAGV